MFAYTTKDGFGRVLIFVPNLCRMSGSLFMALMARVILSAAFELNGYDIER